LKKFKFKIYARIRVINFLQDAPSLLPLLWRSEMYQLHSFRRLWLRLSLPCITISITIISLCNWLNYD